jgi:hypothetical protein
MIAQQWWSDVMNTAPVMQQVVKLLAECGVRMLQQAVPVLVAAGAHASCCSWPSHQQASCAASWVDSVDTSREHLSC